MRFIAFITLLFISTISFGQDIRYKLSGPTKKKWVGQNIYITSSEENQTNLTFFRTQKVAEENRKYNSKKKPQEWSVISGTYLNDSNIVVQIGGKDYRAAFSWTNNGKEFMTLTSIPEREEDAEVIKTYYVE